MLAEFGEGLWWVLGRATPTTLFLVDCMNSDAGMVHIPADHRFVVTRPSGPSYEPALGYLAIAVTLLAGPAVPRLGLEPLQMSDRDRPDVRRLRETFVR